MGNYTPSLQIPWGAPRQLLVLCLPEESQVSVSCSLEVAALQALRCSQALAPPGLLHSLISYQNKMPVLL